MAWYAMQSVATPWTAGNLNTASGYVLKAYQAGTSTNIPMATDNTGGTQVNDIVLDANGYTSVSGTIFIPHIDQTYKIALYPTQAAADADTGAVWTVDNLPLPGGAGGSLRTDLSDTTDNAKNDALVSGKRAETNSTAFTYHAFSENRWLSAETDFGVVADGTDYSTELQAAFTAAAASRIPLLLPFGTIGVATEITYSDYITVIGAGRSNTTITALAGCAGTVLSPVAGSAVIDATFNNFAVNGNSIAAGGIAIGLDDLTFGGIHCTVENVSAYGCTSYGINFNKANNSKVRHLYAAGGAKAVAVYDTRIIFMDYVHAQDATELFYVHGSTGCNFRDLYLFNETAYLTTVTFLHIDNSWANYFERLHLEPQQSGGGYSLSELVWITDDGTAAERSVDNTFFLPRVLTLGYSANGFRIGETASSGVNKTRIVQGEFLDAGAGYHDILLEKANRTFLSRNIAKITYTTPTVSAPTIGRIASTEEYIEDYDDKQPEIKAGTLTLAAGVGSVIYGATDATGSTDGATAVITGMTDTSDFTVGNKVTVSAGFPSAVIGYEILSLTATSVTLDTNSTSAQAGVTVSEIYFADTNYRLIVTPDANETIYRTAKTPSGFSLASSNGASTADVDWLAVGVLSARDQPS